MGTRIVLGALLAVMLATPVPAVAQSQQPATSTAAVGAPETAPAATPDRLAKVRADAEARRSGRRARVRLVDGTVARGRIIGVMDTSLALQPTPADEPVMYEFAQIESIEGAGWPRWVWATVGVGAAAAIIGIAAAAN